MGDAKHSRRRSDHNEGNAIDITRDEGHGPNLELLLADFVRQMVANPNGRIRYMIHRGRIAHSEHGFMWRTYSGPNPHTNHAHISIASWKRDERRAWRIVG
jgi:hypothetical protein